MKGFRGTDCSFASQLQNESAVAPDAGGGEHDKAYLLYGE
jgi:hypothetical protein